MNACSKISVWIGILFLSTFDVFAAYKISFINNTPYQVQATYYYSKIIKTASERKTISPHGSVQYEHGAWCGLGLSVTVNGPFGTINLSDRFNIACCNITWELNEVEKTNFATKLSLNRLKSALLKENQVNSRPLKLLKATYPSLAMESAHVVI